MKCVKNRGLCLVSDCDPLKTAEIYTTIILLGSSFNKLFASVRIGCNRVWQGLQCETTLKKKKKKERKSFGVKSKHVWPRIHSVSTILTRRLIISVDANTEKSPLIWGAITVFACQATVFQHSGAFLKWGRSFFPNCIQWNEQYRPGHGFDFNSSEHKHYKFTVTGESF